MIGMQDQALPLYFRGILDGDEREHTGGKHHPEVISSCGAQRTALPTGMRDGWPRVIFHHLGHRLLS